MLYAYHYHPDVLRLGWINQIIANVSMYENRQKQQILSPQTQNPKLFLLFNSIFNNVWEIRSLMLSLFH